MLVVDVANVVGSRPDGWWRDRVGATQRLLDRLAGAGLDGAGPDGAGPDGAGLDGAGLDGVVAVVEGRATAVVDVPGLTVVRATGSGDDEVVRQALAHPGCTVVTADRGLRARLPGGTTVLGPGTLLRRLDGGAP